MKYIILLLISLNVFANYIPEDEVGTGNNLTVFTKKNKCELHYSKTCIKIPYGYTANYHILVDEYVDDTSSPITTKNDITACVDETDCYAKAGVLSCTDVEEYKTFTEWSEVYCTKTTGYEQMLSGKKIVVEDAALKTAWEAAEAVKAQKAAYLKAIVAARDCGNSVINEVIYRNNVMKTLTPTQKETVLITYGPIMNLLEVGNLDQAKVKVQEATVDGVIMTEADKTAIISLIDSCP